VILPYGDAHARAYQEKIDLVSPIGGDTGGSENLSTSLSNVARLAAHPKFVWVFSPNSDGTTIYNNPVGCYTSTFCVTSISEFIYTLLTILTLSGET
jgi:hypothetical protein